MNGCKRTIQRWVASPPLRKVKMKVARKIASGTTQRNGAEAMSVEICEVTASSMAEGTKASAIQESRSRALGVTAAAFSSVSACEAGRRVAAMSRPATPIMTISSTKPKVQASDCWRSVRNGSSTTG